MFWFYFTVIGVIIIFSPIVLQLSFFVSKNAKKVFFSVYFYGAVKIVSGYLTFDVDKTYVHLSKKFAVQVAYKDVLFSPKRINVIKGIEILSIKNELNIDNIDLFNQVMFSTICMYAYSVLITIISHVKPFINLKCGVKRQRNDDLADLFDILIAFNLFAIIKITLKKVMGVINEKKQIRNSYQTSA